MKVRGTLPIILFVISNFYIHDNKDNLSYQNNINNYFLVF